MFRHDGDLFKLEKNGNIKNAMSVMTHCTYHEHASVCPDLCNQMLPLGTGSVCEFAFVAGRIQNKEGF